MKFSKYSILWRLAIFLSVGIGVPLLAIWIIKERERRNDLQIPERTTPLTFSEKMFSNPESIEQQPVRLDPEAVAQVLGEQEEFAVVKTYSDRPREAGNPDRVQLERYEASWDGLRDPEVRDPQSESNRQLANQLMEKRRARLMTQGASIESEN